MLQQPRQGQTNRKECKQKRLSIIFVYTKPGTKEQNNKIVRNFLIIIRKFCIFLNAGRFFLELGTDFGYRVQITLQILKIFY